MMRVCILGLLCVIASSRAIGAGGVVGDSHGLADATAPGLPLAATRHIRFITHEVTWLSPDLSPDGRRLVFDVLGDLYSLPIEGGQAKRLTSGLAFDYDPTFTPDGGAVTFHSDRSGIRAMWQLGIDAVGTVQGVPLPRADLKVPSSREDTGHSHFYESNPAVMGQFVRAADGTQYSRRCQLITGVGVVGPRATCEIVRERSGGGGGVDTLARQSGDIEGLTLSRDGRWLAYSNQAELIRTALHVIDLTTGDDRVILDDSHPIIRLRGGMMVDRYNNERVPRSVFTPDNRELITAQGGRVWRIDISTGKKREIPMTIDVDAELAPLLKWSRRVNDGPVIDTQLRDLAQAPDGHRFAFQALGKIYVMDDRGGKPRRLTSEHWFPVRWTESSPAWAPDGRSLVVVVTEGGQQSSEVWRIGPDESAPQKLAPATGELVRHEYSRPRFLSGGDRVLVYDTVATEVKRDHYLVTLSASAAARSTPQGAVLTGLAANPKVIQLLPWAGSSHSRGAPVDLVLTAPIIAQDPNLDDLLPICAAPLHADGTRAAALTYLFTVINRRGAMQTDFMVPDPVVLHSRSVQLSADGFRVAIHAGGSIALGVVPSDVRSRLDALASRARNAETSEGADDPRCLSAPEFAVGDPNQLSDKVDTLPVAVGANPLWGEGGLTLRYTLGPFIYRYDLTRAGLGGARPKPPAHVYQPQAIAVDVRAPIDRPAGTLVLEHARVIPMTGDTVLEDCDIVVTDGRIQAVGAHGSLGFPRDAKIIDGKGLTVLPGFADIHTHGVFWAQGQGTDSLLFLAYGVTILYNPNFDWTDVAKRTELGDVVGPRLYSSGAPIYDFGARGFWPHYHSPTGTLETVLPTLTVDDVLPNLSGYEWITQRLKWRTDREQRRDTQLFMMAAQGKGLAMTSHHDDLSITRILDGFAGLEHAWPTIPLYDDFLRFFAASGTTVTPTLMAESIVAPSINWPREAEKLRHFLPSLWDGRPNSLIQKGYEGRLYGDDAPYQDRVALQYAATQLARVVAAGGKVGIGNDESIPGLSTHLEMDALVDGGFTPMQALRAGTRDSIDALGLLQDLGTVEAGKLADLVILKEDPMADIRNTTSIKYVVKNGRLYDADTAREIWPRDLARPVDSVH